MMNHERNVFLVYGRVLVNVKHCEVHGVGLKSGRDQFARCDETNDKCVRWKESRELYYAVVEPLIQFSGERYVSKVIVAVLVAGGKAACTNRGRTASLQQRKQKREFNPTKGFPGEDIQI